MTMMGFQKATKKKQKARIGLIGPAGSGKTYTALCIGKALGSPIAVIDTERGSASKYSGDVADFDVCELTDEHGRPDYSPRAYIDAIKMAAAGGYPVLVIDSLSHAWEGEGGILDQADKKGGRFDVWKDLSPQARALIDAILTYPGHVIATMRVKTAYEIEEVQKGDRVVKVPRKIGLAPRFKEGLEYELDVVGNLDENNVLTITKSRCPGLTGESIAKPGEALARRISMWLDEGADEEKRLAGLISSAEGPLDLDRVKTEIARAVRWKLIDDAALERLVSAGTAARGRMMEGKVA